jgi:hypothetical protein
VSTVFERRVKTLEVLSPTIEGSREARAKERQAWYARIEQENPISEELPAAIRKAGAEEWVDVEESARVHAGLAEFFDGGEYLHGYLRGG